MSGPRKAVPESMNAPWPNASDSDMWPSSGSRCRRRMKLPKEPASPRAADATACAVDVSPGASRKPRRCP
eukprot:4412855-Pleurochrysis_carterae.AAC.1